MASRNIRHCNDVIELDCEIVSKIFKKLKSKGIYNKNIKYYNGSIANPSEELLSSSELQDIFRYYRLKKKISLKELAKRTKIDVESYRLYESKRLMIDDFEKIERIIKALELENKIKLPIYYKIMKNYPIDKLKQIVKSDRSNFIKETGINPSTIRSWLDKTRNLKKVSTNTYKKMTNYFLNHELIV